MIGLSVSAALSVRGRTKAAIDEIQQVDEVEVFGMFGGDLPVILIVTVKLEAKGSGDWPDKIPMR